MKGLLTIIGWAVIFLAMMLYGMGFMVVVIVAFIPFLPIMALATPRMIYCDAVGKKNKYWEWRLWCKIHGFIVKQLFRRF